MRKSWWTTTGGAHEVIIISNVLNDVIVDVVKACTFCIQKQDREKLPSALRIHDQVRFSNTK